ncbi:DUF4276 domain-containing protein [Mucilaginibacter galii]|uniref:DUF4276 family protein n=1 Tax=Mucilaginibacter galii TaxID=2005073 RepID=A0A917JCQ4_9SPHI|nr:DUF4276 family protein [Mucilaginibacter galii]GGI51314.1 hypothetical protein GCM10011425_25260 [Mucilaginibacter galii]
MIRVGLVGEDPNDTASIKHLLEKKYSNKVKFLPLARRIRGDQLESAKLRKSLPIEFTENKCSFVIYIRDLDAFESQSAKVQERKRWFKSLDSVINNKGILLLNIWELEALILGDIDTFNSIYKINHKFSSNPMLQDKPKELLKRITSHTNKQYKEAHCPELFKLLDIDKIEKSCLCFKNFIADFEKKLKKP